MHDAFDLFCHYEHNADVPAAVKAAAKVLGLPNVHGAEVSRYRLSQETGVSEATLSRFVRGERGPDMSSADKLAAFLGLTLVATKDLGKER